MQTDERVSDTCRKDVDLEEISTAHSVSVSSTRETVCFFFILNLCAQWYKHYSFCASVKNATHDGVDQAFTMSIFVTEESGAQARAWRAVLVAEAPPLSISFREIV